ncbi:MAG: sigma-70 family RNA polymerase sigma factor [Bacteroidales bacterium]|nr:sigma-70 family RNA polymerase sigma factor [Bacteroidales bacterium]
MNPKKGWYQNTYQDLIERCKAQDQSAQFEIYKLYYKSMFNTGLRIVKNHAVAEDIMQEAFLLAFSRIDTYKGEVSFGAWLRRIVINKSIDYIRARKVKFEELDNNISVTGEISQIDEDEEKEQLEKIKKAIEMLSDGYRIVLSLYLIEGYDHEEIGQILQISPSSSRSQLTRAKQKLLELLKKK